MKRASLAEMIVPYGDVAPDHGFKHVMDVGEYGFGNFANSLELGCDCLGEIRYLDAHYALPDGDTHVEAERDLHPRGGRRDPLEALGPLLGRERGAAQPPAGGLVDPHRRQLRVRHLLVPLPRRHDPARDEADRHPQHERDRGGRRDPVRPPDRPPAGRAAPPAPVLHAARPRHRRHGQHRRPDRQRGAPARARQPVPERVRGPRDAAAPRVGGRRSTRTRRPRGTGRSDRPRSATRSASRRATA